MDMHMHHPQTPAGAATAAPPMPAARHGMAVVGDRAIFMSHLPMFMPVHGFQVILRVGLGATAEAVYRADRKSHPAAKLYTFDPDAFVLPDVLPGAGGAAPRSSSFSGTLVRHHFEQPPAHAEPPVEIARGVTVKVLDVVHAHRFASTAGRPPSLSYVMFGRGEERFAAHLISGPPDFDQLLKVTVTGLEFSDDELSLGRALTMAPRKDALAKRVKPSDGAVPCRVASGQHTFAVELKATEELYLETADLRAAM